MNTVYVLLVPPKCLFPLTFFLSPLKPGRTFLKSLHILKWKQIHSPADHCCSHSAWAPSHLPLSNFSLPLSFQNKQQSCLVHAVSGFVKKVSACLLSRGRVRPSYPVFSYRMRFIGFINCNRLLTLSKGEGIH